MSIADLMEAMAAAGAPMEAILIAVRAIEAKDREIAARDADTASRREKDAARKRLEREGARVHGRSTDSHGTIQGLSVDCPAEPALSRPPNENNSNPPTHTHPDMTPRARKADPFPMPDWADPQVWADWMDVRKAKRCRNTATAHKQFLADVAAEANDEWPPGRLLEHAVAKSWASIHRPTENRHDRQFRNGEPSRHDEIRDPIAAVVAERQAASAAAKRREPGGWPEDRCGTA